MGIVVISSELPEIIGISDRILTFCEGGSPGRSAADATQEKLLNAATMREEDVV
jgi:ABC-type sugar transport system ATPase subunit